MPASFRLVIIHRPSIRLPVASFSTTRCSVSTSVFVVVLLSAVRTFAVTVTSFDASTASPAVTSWSGRQRSATLRSAFRTFRASDTFLCSTVWSSRHFVQAACIAPSLPAAFPLPACSIFSTRLMTSMFLFWNSFILLLKSASAAWASLNALSNSLIFSSRVRSGVWLTKDTP